MRRAVAPAGELRRFFDETYRTLWGMAATLRLVDSAHPPDGVVLLPGQSDSDSDSQLNPRDWVQAVRQPAPRRLRQRVADHVAAPRELGEV